MRGSAWVCVAADTQIHADPRFPPGLLLPLPLLKGVGFDSVLVLAHTDVDLRTRACIYFSYLFISRGSASPSGCLHPDRACLRGPCAGVAVRAGASTGTMS